MTLTNLQTRKLTNNQDSLSDTALWVEAAPLQARLSTDGWTVKSHSHLEDGVRTYHCTVWRMPLRKALKAWGLTPLEALHAAYALACETTPPNKFIVPEEWKVHL